MKTLIISNDNIVIDFFSKFLSKRGYDVISYRWLMKAMDNLEEIKPQIIIVNSDEYPRHWKTIASFLQSGLGGNDINLYLYAPTALEDEDEKKANALGVKKIFSQLDEEKLSFEFKNLKRSEINYPEYWPAEVDSIILTNPEDNSFSYGSVEEQDGNTYICNISENAKFVSGQVLKYVSFCHGGNYTNCSAQIVKIDRERRCLSLRIKELYEAV